MFREFFNVLNISILNKLVHFPLKLLFSQATPCTVAILKLKLTSFSISSFDIRLRERRKRSMKRTLTMLLANGCLSFLVFQLSRSAIPRTSHGQIGGNYRKLRHYQDEEKLHQLLWFVCFFLLYFLSYFLQFSCPLLEHQVATAEAWFLVALV